MPSASEIVSRVRISNVWRALGGGSLRQCRGCAFWRPKADSWSVAVDDAKGTWYDHRDDCGGGVLDLVQHVLHCTRQEALKWLADLAGVTLDNRPPTPADRARWAHASREAEVLTAWRREQIALLRAWRNHFWDASQDAQRWLRMHATEPADLDNPLTVAALRSVSAGERIGDALNDALDGIGELTPDAMRELRSRLSGVKVAA